jgi:hypothetical protein
MNRLPLITLMMLTPWACTLRCEASPVNPLPTERTLTDVHGRKVEAVVLVDEGTGLRIRRKADGREFTIPLERLSPQDRQWIVALREIKDLRPSKLDDFDPDLESPERIERKPAVPPPSPHPKPELISNEKIHAQQVATGMVMPPDGGSALRTHLVFKGRQPVPGYVYDVKDDRFWYAGLNMVQKSASLDELEPWCRMTLESWKNPSRLQPTPSMAFIVKGEKIHASCIPENDGSLTFLEESGNWIRNVAMEDLDEMGRKFVAGWKDQTWMPDVWEWAIGADFTAVKPFSNSGRALAKKEGRWGVIDLAGKHLDALRFDQIRAIPDSRNLKVSINGKWGLLAEDATLLLPPVWEDVGDLHHGMIPVRSNGKWGYAEAGGKLVIPCQWDDAWRFSLVGTAVVTFNGKRGFVNRNGTVIVKPEWDGAILHTAERIGAVRRGRGWALIHSTGKLLCEPTWNFNWSERRFELGFIPAWPMDSPKTERTLLGIDGKPGAVPTLRHGVCLPGSASQSPHPWKASDTLTRQFPFPRLQSNRGKIGLIDQRGDLVLKPEFDEIHMVSPDLISVQQNDKSRIITRDGKVIVEGDFRHYAVSLLTDLPALKVDKDRTTRLYWLDGTPVVPDDAGSFHFVDTYGGDPVYSETIQGAPPAWWRVDSQSRERIRFEGAARIYWVKSLADHGRIWIEDSTTKRWHFCDVHGTRLGLEMESQPHNWFFDEGFGVMWEDAQCYFVNRDGNRLDFGHWEDARYFRQGFVAVKKNGRWGFIDKTGKTVVACEYDDVGNFFIASTDRKSNGPLLAAVCKAGKWGYINPKGEIVIPLTGDRQGDWNRGRIYLYSKEHGSKYYDARGQQEESNDFSAMQNIPKNPDDLSHLVTENHANLAGLVNERGEVILHHEWQAIAWLYSDLFAVRGEADGGLYSLKDGWVFRDNDRLRIERDPHRNKLQLTWARHGLFVVEETPKWGFARWKNLTPVNGLLAHYALDGDTKDSSGMEKHASGNENQWTADKHGKSNSALYLDGSKNYVTCPLDIQLKNTPKLTLVAWVRSDSEGKWRHVLGMCHNRSIELAGGWVARGTGGKWDCFGHRKMNVGEWVFLAASYDDEVNNMTLRVNEEIFHGQKNNWRSSHPFTLGGPYGQASFKGAIDEVRVYNRILSQEELNALYEEFRADSNSQAPETD